jgi:hypothetical protein
MNSLIQRTYLSLLVKLYNFATLRYFVHWYIVVFDGNKAQYMKVLVVIKLFKIKKNPNTETVMQTYFAFLCILHVLALYPMVYFREYPFTQLLQTSMITDTLSPL